MPVYEYQCSRCRHRFEVRQSFSDEAGADCPECDARAHRVFSPVGIIFKGSGFYATDHGRGNRLGQGSNGDGSDSAPSHEDSHEVKETQATKKETQATTAESS